MSRRFTEAEIPDVWKRRKAGELTRSIARRLGRNGSSIRRLFEDAGGVRSVPRRRAERHLTLVEREEISRGVATGDSLRTIASRLGRAASTISREVARDDGRDRYRAHRADRAAWQRPRRPQPCKLATNPEFRAEVEDKLAVRWSPQQISGWLRHTYPSDEAMHVSHETLTLFIQARGGLKRELTQHLRTRRTNRRPKGTSPPSGKGQIVDPVVISERPAEVEDLPAGFSPSNHLWIEMAKTHVMRVGGVRAAGTASGDGGGGDDPAFGGATGRVYGDDYTTRDRFTVYKSAADPVGFDQVIAP